MNILLIEPNRLLAKTYRRALEQAEYTVHWQQAAQAAVFAAEAIKPDVIILELQLAGHSGIEFLYELRSYSDWQAIPVVLHTFVPEENFVLQREQFHRLGIEAYLYKPATSLRELITAVSDLPVVAA